MSLDPTEAQDSSATPTPTAEERARSPEDSGPIDAEVVEETPAPKKPRVARVADVKKLDASADDVFGAPVTDTHNARSRGPGTSDDAPPKRSRRKKAAPEPAPEPTDKHIETARGVVMLADSFFIAHVRQRYADSMTPESVEQLASRLAMKPEQVDALSEPLARGLAEEGVELPWWAQLGMAAAGVYLPKLMLLTKLDEQAAAAKGATP